MQLGMIGLGRMGGSMVTRLLRGGHDCVVLDREPQAIAPLFALGARGAASPQDLVQQLSAPRTLWLMVPAAAVDALLAQLIPLLAPGDTVIDGGNSRHRDDLRRADLLRATGIHHLDVGTSGGVAGLERGYCLMVGGDAAVVQGAAPLFETLAPGSGTATPTPGRAPHTGTARHGWLHCGPHGAGHFVKMVHNGIEYGLMAAYAEGFNLLQSAGIGRPGPTAQGTQASAPNAETAPLDEPELYAYDMNLADIAELWRRGSVISSWLLDLSAEALVADPTLAAFEGRVSDSGEGRWAVQAAMDVGVPVPVLSATLSARFASRGESGFALRLQSAMRHEFGGHAETAPAKDESH